MRSHRSLAALLFTFFCWSAPACDSEVEPDGGVPDEDAGEPMDAGTDAGPRPPDVCDELGLTRAPIATSTGIDFGDVAGDFTVDTLDGSYHYAEARSGCESYVFLNYIQDLRSTPTGTWFGDTIWNGNGIDGFLLEGPRNVQYFYTSYEPDAAARATRMEAMRTLLEEKLAFRFPGDLDEQAFWRSRFHFVTDRVSEIEGSVGAHFTDYFAFTRSAASLVDLGERGMASAPLPFFFGIDRHQRFHAGDDLSPFVGGTPSLMMAAYVGHYYNHLFEVDEHLASDGATVVALLDGERTTERVFNREVTLPDAATMAGFDTLEIEVAIGCDERNPFACSEWDRIADVMLCLDETCTERREIARWITPYWRRGPQHWTIDATPFLPLLAAGGASRFYVETGPSWERATEYVGTVALRFSDSGDDGPVPAGAVRVFTGGTFDATYNERDPVSVDIPADATSVELVTILSGHGQVDGSNCAEWCDHRHLFTVNGTALPAISHTGAVGSSLGCADRVGEGVPPNQLGNWAPERAYWCPGLPVEARRDDLTSLVTPGEALSIDYEGRYRTGTPSGGDIDLSAYVVWYR